MGEELTIGEKLSTISYVMGDGYAFIKIRLFLEDLESKDFDTSDASHMLSSIDTIYKLCEYFKTPEDDLSMQ